MVDLNPFSWLGDAAKEGVADGFTAMMMSLWSAALWLLQTVFGLLDQFTTPQLDDGGLAHLYGVALGISAGVALVIAMGQLGLAAIRRDGRHLATLAAGLAQYGAVVTVWVGVCAGLVLGCAGLSRALLSELLGVESFSGYAAGSGWVDQVSGTVEAAVLGVCALFMLIPAALGYLLIMLAREGALLVLVSTMPIAAAGALGESTRAWMWKSTRWFLAACLTAPLLALVLGLGVQISHAALPDASGRPDGAPRTASELGAGAHTTDAVRSVGAGDPDDTKVPDTAANVGLAVVGCVIMLVGCVCPMALFRLLAFVDPGTGSGAAFRSTLSASGGVAGVLSGGALKSSGSSMTTSAQTTDQNGQSAGESAAEAETTTRYSSKLAHVVPGLGRAAGGTMSALGGVAAQGASLGVDVMGQAGVGHQGYYDTSRQRGSAGSTKPRRSHGPRDLDGRQEGTSGHGAPDVGAPRTNAPTTSTPGTNAAAGAADPAGSGLAADAALLA